MNITNRIAELEGRRAELQIRLQLTAAELSATDHELKVLRHELGHGEDPTAMRFTDAIIATLRAAQGPLSPTEIETRLASKGRVETLSQVTATLNHLIKHQRVIRPGRGRYLAV